MFRGDSTLLDEKKGLKTFLRRRFLNWVYRHVDIALYVGSNNKQYFRVHGLKEKQLLPALHAIDNERFSHLTSEQQQFIQEKRTELKINPTDFVVLFAGKLEEKKNPFFLLELSKRTNDPQIIFLFTGNGHLEEELKARSKNDCRIKFLNFQNQSMMPAVYSLGNVFLLPSKGPGETWGLAANEAMASGLPVLLSTKAGGAIDLVKDNGQVFDPSGTEIVQIYIEALKNSKELYNNNREASLNHIKKFSFTQIAEAVETACTR
jgi:glycosyltransferase involved in cell wall biosynthesis